MTEAGFDHTMATELMEGKDVDDEDMVEDDDPVSPSHKELAKNNGILYTVTDVPPLGTCVLLGLQHYLTMLGATVLIPLILCPAMGASGLQTAQVISSIFFVSGINTVSVCKA